MPGTTDGPDSPLMNHTGIVNDEKSVWMCVCVCVCVYGVCGCVCACVWCVCVFMYVYMCVCVSNFACRTADEFIVVRPNPDDVRRVQDAQKPKGVCVCVCVCVCMCMCVCVCVCVYV